MKRGPIVSAKGYNRVGTRVDERGLRCSALEVVQTRASPSSHCANRVQTFTRKYRRGCAARETRVHTLVDDLVAPVHLISRN